MTKIGHQMPTIIIWAQFVLEVSGDHSRTCEEVMKPFGSLDTWKKFRFMTGKEYTSSASVAH